MGADAERGHGGDHGNSLLVGGTDNSLWLAVLEAEGHLISRLALFNSSDTFMCHLFSLSTSCCSQQHFKMVF